LEYALLTDICRKNDINLRNDVEVAYFYYDDFVGDVRLYEGGASPMIQGDTTVMDEPNASIGLVSPQYHLQPFYVIDENHRMNVVRECLETLRDSGMKVVIGKPFSRFETSSYVFEDEEAIRPEEVLGIDKVERYEGLERPLALFDLMATVGAEADLNNSYLELDRDELHSIANFVVVNHDSDQPMRHTSKFEKATEYLETYHGDNLMEMKQVAQNGMNLFGKQYDSKYKKTKVFRECLDSFLSGMSQGMDDDVLLEHVAGQVYDAAKREDYAGHVEYEETMEFVESVKEYLQENEMYDLKRMSDWENALVNSYYFAYDQLLYGDNNEN
jgi:CRISPR-associated protein Csc3